MNIQRNNTNSHSAQQNFNNNINRGQAYQNNTPPKVNTNSDSDALLYKAESTQSQNTFSSVDNSSKTYNKLEKASFIVFLITLILSPIAFIPINFTPLDTSKTIIITFGVLISSILYAISLFKDRKSVIPNHPITIVSLLLIVSTIISSLLSTNIHKSLFGQDFELTTASFFVLMFVSLYFVFQSVYKNKERLSLIYNSLVLSFLVLFVFQVIRVFSPTFLSLGILNSTTSTLIGKWYDLGIFSASIFLLSFFNISLQKLKGSLKFAPYVLLVLSGLTLFIINSAIIWSILSIVLLGYGIYYYVKTENDKTGLNKIVSKISIITLVLFIISSVLTFKGNDLATSAIKSLNLEQTEIVLPWQLTLDVASDTIKERPLFGAGPNRFVNQFLIHKPEIINPTIFWNVEFSTGFGYIPSFVVTHGVVGSILWVLFFIFYFILGVKSLKNIKDENSKFAIISTFFITTFLWLISFVYNPSHSVLFITYVMTGLFLAVLSSENILKIKNCAESSSKLMRRLFDLIAIVLIIAFLFWIAFYAKKLIAITYFQSGITSLNTNQVQGIGDAEKYFKKALSWYSSDVYYQALSQIDIIKINSLTQQIQAQQQQDPKSINPEVVKTLNSLIEEGVKYSRAAIAIDPSNYYNYISEAKVSELAASLQIGNAYENAKTDYANALALNPYNPSIYLNLARLETSRNNLVDAQKFIGNALQLKQNYLDAIFLLSQIQVTQGRIKEAITSVQVATQINPNDPLLFFQLGFLDYNDKNYQGAVDAFSKAVELNSQYANARYFLGLSYARLNKNVEAVQQFEELAKTNPENKEIFVILSNLKAGKSPFAEAKAPIDSKPEKRKTLPVKEKTN